MSAQPKKILVTGANGQVGQELARFAWPENISIKTTTRVDLDITDAAAVADCAHSFKPDVIVNAAAYTAVDKAEEDEKTAFAVNETAVGHLAKAADDNKASLIHISTDYVFDGRQDGWYDEVDRANPLGVYGASKLAGEAAALAAKRAVVLRTSWVYSALGPNFVQTMRRLATEGKAIGVVADQHGCPTSAADIATAIATVIDQNVSQPGLYHFASIDDATWWDLADEAISLAGFDIDIKKLTTPEYPTPAPRPRDTRLSSANFAASYDFSAPPWRESLKLVSDELTVNGLK